MFRPSFLSPDKNFYYLKKRVMEVLLKALQSVLQIFHSNPTELEVFYHSLPTGPRHAEQLQLGTVSVAASHPELVRYCDCYPQDSHLCPTSSGAGFLNASLVELSKRRKSRYIAAAGPMAPEWYGTDTRAAFWSAVWANHVRVIVALAVPQKGVQGCAEYTNAREYRSVGLRVEPIIERDGISLSTRERIMRLTHAESGCQRNITQVEFQQWPNYGVPNAASMVAQLALRVEHLQRQDEVDAGAGGESSAPLLVHCAGGVGRTGTFLTLLSLWEDREELISPDALFRAVVERVAALRRQRHPYCVESAAQFGLIFSALREMALLSK